MVKQLVQAIPEQIRDKPLPVTIGSLIFFGGLLTAAGWQSKHFITAHTEELEEVKARLDRLERKTQYRWTVQMMKRYAQDQQAGNDMLYSPDVEAIAREFRYVLDEEGNH